MKKAVFILLLIVLCQIGYSAKEIHVNETELVSLVPDGYDPDNDPVAYSFTKPLNSYGKWQTTYGDAGEYNIVVSASDGELLTSENVKLIVEKKEESPVIDSYSPAGEAALDEGSARGFKVSASDLNKDLLIYEWLVDGAKAGEGQSFSYSPTYFDAGKHSIRAVVSDSASKAEKEWAVTVNKVDRSRILDGFKDIKVTETGTIRMGVPDFKRYNLEYTISEPVGNDGTWETGYDDAGEYDVTIRITDGSFSSEKRVKVKVADKDRLPVFSNIRNIKLVENEKVEFKAEANDADGDPISFYAENMPGGATFTGNTFSWQTNYDTVKKESLIDSILDKFHLLGRDFIVTFVAKSKENEARMNVKITVLDVNRQPVLSDIPDITADEGAAIIIAGQADDPDGDNITYSCSGWIDICNYTTDYNDAGIYTVRLTASDGFLYDSKDAIIKVNNVNMEPVLTFRNYSIREGERLEVKLEASDADRGDATIKAIGLPANASFEGNIFNWTVGFDTAQNDSVNATIGFSASDGTATATKDMLITVYNVNRAPEIINASPVKEFITYAGNEVEFRVAAEDPDKDTLSYKWRFGLFEGYNATSVHLRRFTTPGIKDIKVIVSDGKLEDSFEWKVKVISYDKYMSMFK